MERIVVQILEMSLSTSALKMEKNIRNDDYIVLMSIKNKPSNAVFFLNEQGI